MSGEIKTLNSGSKVVVVKKESSAQIGEIITCRRLIETSSGMVAESGKPLRLPADCFRD